MPAPSAEETDRLHGQLEREAAAAGYHLNPDRAFARDLAEGLLVNERRYGYRACPCRLASGDAGADRDIVCPCDYRDPDLDRWGACYCALYVSQEVLDGKKSLGSIPDRRPPPSQCASPASTPAVAPSPLPYPVWRCSVCGYLCARDAPPEVCPVCKVKKDRFTRFI
jgi:ferredoxin-thioredoxin reductase catalytic subunit/rubredoxin